MKNLLSIVLLSLSSHTAVYAKPIFESPFQVHSEGTPITIPRGYTFPSCLDLDKDGLKDLILGEYGKGGELYFYKNIGSKTTPEYGKAQNLMVGDKILKVPGIGI